MNYSEQMRPGIIAVNKNKYNMIHQKLCIHNFDSVHPVVDEYSWLI